MSESKLIYRDKSYTIGGLIIATLLTIGTGVIGFRLIAIGFSYNSIPWTGIFGGILLLAISVMIIIGTLTSKGTDYYEDKMVLRTFLGKIIETLYYRDIQYWFEEINQDKDKNDVHTLYYFLMDKRYSIAENSVKNYDELKAAITKGKVEDQSRKNEFDAKFLKFNYKVAFTFAFFTLFLGLIIYNSGSEPIPQTDLKTVNGILADTPIVHTSGRGGSTHRLTFKLRNSSQGNYIIDKIGYEAADISSLLQNIRVGDTLAVDIQKHDSIQYLTKVGWTDVGSSVFGLRHDNKAYLTLNEYNVQNKSDYKDIAYVVWGLLGFLNLGVFYSMWKASLKSRKGTAST